MELYQRDETLFYFYKYPLVVGIARRREVLLSEVGNDVNGNTVKEGSGENNKCSVDVFPLSFTKVSPAPKTFQSYIKSGRRKGAF